MPDLTPSHQKMKLPSPIKAGWKSIPDYVHPFASSEYRKMEVECQGRTDPDKSVKSRNSIKFVIPAKAGIQLFQDVLDPGFRRGDASTDFLRDHQP